MLCFLWTPSRHIGLIRSVPLWFRLVLLGESIGLAALWVADDAAPARFGFWFAGDSNYAPVFAFTCSMFVTLIPAYAQIMLAALWIRHKQRRAPIPEARINS